MAFLWRLQRYESDFTNVVTIDTTDDIESITWRRTLYGNCQEASIVANVSNLDTIGHRYIIDIQTNLDDAGWVSRYRGMVTQPGSARASGLSTIKLVGLKQKLYRMKLGNLYFPEEDLYDRIETVLTNSNYRAHGTSFTANTTFLPGSVSSSFSLTMPAFATGIMYVGEFLDAMAEASGKLWIVDATGRIIFGDITGSQSFTEGSGNTEVEYTVADSEAFAYGATLRIPSVNMPNSVVADVFSIPFAESRNAVRPVFERSNYSISYNDYLEEVIVDWEFGLPPNTRQTLTSSSYSNITDPTNSQDNDADTFAITTDDTLATIYAAEYSNKLIDGFFIKYESTEEVKVILENNYGSSTSIGATQIEYLEFYLPKSEDGQEGQIFLIPHDPSFNVSGSTRWAQVRIETAVGELTLYELYGVQVDSLISIAGSYLKAPTDEAATITRTSTTLLEPTPTINLTPASGGSIAFTGGALEQVIDKNKGVKSIIIAGQEYDPDSVALNALEEYEFKKASRKTSRYGWF